MDEFDIIARYFAPLAKDPGALSLKDDAAFIPPRPGFDLVITTDQITEDTDFFATDPPEMIAQKGLRVSLSDLAAKGAAPAFYLLNLTLPQGVSEDWLAAFASGLRRDQAEFDISLLGGDMGAGRLAIAVTGFGFVPKGRMVKRSGAKVGDAVYVTGTIGDSSGGLALLKGRAVGLGEAERAYLVNRYRVPQPPVAFGKNLYDTAHASVDVSDGLIADLGHVASASGVRIVVESERVPLSPEFKALWGPDAFARAVAAGDDYQIAFTASPDSTGPFTRIGHVVAGDGVSLTVKGELVAIPSPGYRHF
ncbi:MAG TPA: thiamine-phosphate kinase [Rhizomicrobium sp.]|nr:thiamine-phosphate kinase [Rhizomicrobium sp.]